MKGDYFNRNKSMWPEDDKKVDFKEKYELTIDIEPCSKCGSKELSMNSGAIKSGQPYDYWITCDKCGHKGGDEEFPPEAVDNWNNKNNPKRKQPKYVEIAKSWDKKKEREFKDREFELSHKYFCC